MHLVFFLCSPTNPKKTWFNRIPRACMDSSIQQAGIAVGSDEYRGGGGWVEKEEEEAEGDGDGITKSGEKPASMGPGFPLRRWRWWWRWWKVVVEVVAGPLTAARAYYASSLSVKLMRGTPQRSGREGGRRQA